MSNNFLIGEKTSFCKVFKDGVIFNNDGLSNNGVKVSFDHEFITISSFPGQTYVLDTDTSCRLKIIIKRLF